MRVTITTVRKPRDCARCGQPLDRDTLAAWTDTRKPMHPACLATDLRERRSRAIGRYNNAIGNVVRRAGLLPVAEEARA